MNTVQGAQVRKARQEAQLTEAQLAEKAGIPYGTVVAIEAGQLEASFEQAEAIAKATRANIFKLYQRPEGQPAYQGNRSKLSGPIRGSDFERLAAEEWHQRELKGYSERERELDELQALEEWHAHASPEARRANIDRVRRRNDLRQGLLGSPTGQRVAAGAVPTAARPSTPESQDVAWTSHGPVPVEPVGGGA